MAVTLLFWSVTFCLFIKEGPMQPISKSYSIETRREHEACRRSTSFSSQGIHSSRGIHGSNSLMHIAQNNWEPAAGEQYTPRCQQLNTQQNMYSNLYFIENSMPAENIANRY
ncbi:hypothetical protein LSAT2_024641 [Lamellibrachia satsuma]|nr:hypothetical protein LSAT2_024641 [Lamellibrachia satsuma]